LDVDVSQFERVGGTDAGDYYEVAPDVLLAYPQDGYVQTESGARASMQELLRIARERGRPLALIVLVDRVRSQDTGGRRVWRDEVDPELVRALALVTRSLLSRAIGSFFLGLTRPIIPTAMVPTFDEAVSWALSELMGRIRASDG
jgi:hypothetical protein